MATILRLFNQHTNDLRYDLNIRTPSKRSVIYGMWRHQTDTHRSVDTLLGFLRTAGYHGRQIASPMMQEMVTERVLDWKLSSSVI